jgi:hypothetical protein
MPEIHTHETLLDFARSVAARAGWTASAAHVGVDPSERVHGDPKPVPWRGDLVLERRASGVKACDCFGVGRPGEPLFDGLAHPRPTTVGFLVQHINGGRPQALQFSGQFAIEHDFNVHDFIEVAQQIFGAVGEREAFFFGKVKAAVQGKIAQTRVGQDIEEDDNP